MAFFLLPALPENGSMASVLSFQGNSAGIARRLILKARKADLKGLIGQGILQGIVSEVPRDIRIDVRSNDLWLEVV